MASRPICTSTGAAATRGKLFILANTFMYIYDNAPLCLDYLGFTRSLPLSSKCASLFVDAEHHSATRRRRPSFSSSLYIVYVYLGHPTFCNIFLIFYCGHLGRRPRFHAFRVQFYLVSIMDTTATIGLSKCSRVPATFVSLFFE